MTAGARATPAAPEVSAAAMASPIAAEVASPCLSSASAAFCLPRASAAPSGIITSSSH